MNQRRFFGRFPTSKILGIQKPPSRPFGIFFRSPVVGFQALWNGGDAWPLTCCSEAGDGAFLAAQRDGKVVPVRHQKEGNFTKKFVILVVFCKQGDTNKVRISRYP